MLKNYFTIALRNLRKHKGYAFINISGLAVGLACCLLIMLYVRDELSFDRFHTKADRIYHVLMQMQEGGGELRMTPPVAFGPTTVEEIPGVEQAVRFGSRGQVALTYQNEPVYEDGFMFSEPSFFEVFDFELLQGDRATALARPRTVVVTEYIAQKYFPDTDPLGQTITIDGSDAYEITGVLRDVPHNSHLQFNFMASLVTQHEAREGSPGWDPWRMGGDMTYLLLSPEASLAALKTAIPGFLKQHLLERDAEKEIKAFVEPLPEMYFHSNWGAEKEGLSGDIRYVYIFSAIAALIILIACINFMNLATARATKRAREVGVRKVVGALRSQLVGQFLGESLIMTGLAMILGIGLAELILPSFSALVEKPLHIDYLGDAFIIPTIIGLMLAVGVLAGSYPAFALSSFKPVHIMKGQKMTAGSGAWLRKGLVVFQFSISTALIIGTLVIQNQLDYIHNKRLGVHGEQVVNIANASRLKGQYEAFKNELLKTANVQRVTTGSIPGTAGAYMATPEGMESKLWMSALMVDTDFLSTMEIELAEGRDFSADLPTDLNGTLLINEAAVKKFGWTDAKSAIGKTVTRLSDSWQSIDSKVIGVVKDFHTGTLRNKIPPLMIILTEQHYFTVLARVNPNDMPATLASLESTWTRFVPDYPFEYDFVDQQFAQLYRAEERLADMFATFSMIAVLIACLGLFGLAAYTAEQRTKEIGIRKVLGASISNIIGLLSKDFVILISVAFVFAVPLAFVSMNKWLEDFAYHVEMRWPVFAIAGIVALAIALLTISYQSIKAAKADPVKSLRYE